jgi:hypothetical protein
MTYGDNTSDDPFAGYPAVLTVADVAKIFRMSPRYVRTLSAAGKIPGAFKVSGSWRYMRGQVSKLIDQGDG